MKKNRTLRVSALLLALTLITTCFVGGTFAKYITSNSGSDTARVAKWGVTITPNGDLFSKTYAKTDSTYTLTTTSVVSTTDKVVAPGTAGNLVQVVLGGTPEVAVAVDYKANLELSNWEVSSAYYCPIEITVGSTTYKGTDYTSAALFEAAVEEAIQNEYSAKYQPGTDLSDASVKVPVVSWAWAFTGNDDVKDTALGDQAVTATAASIKLEITTTVTQVD